MRDIGREAETQAEGEAGSQMGDLDGALRGRQSSTAGPPRPPERSAFALKTLTLLCRPHHHPSAEFSILPN